VSAFGRWRRVCELLAQQDRMIAYHRLTGTVRLKNVLNAADERAKVRRETKTGEEEGGGLWCLGGAAR
jgi:hypothetical protein